jgi:hypothetical protein
MAYPLVGRPAPIRRSALIWWLAFACWFTGSALGLLTHDPVTAVYSYRYASFQPGPMTVVLFAVATVFLASLVLPLRDGARWSRVSLTVLAGPMAGVLAWQACRSLLTGPIGGADIAEGLLCLVALCAVPGAVDLMYRPEVRQYYRQQGDHVP